MCDMKRPCKPTLPRGWVEYSSKSHPERTYYFNMYTGMSSWTCPQPKADADSSRQRSDKDKERQQVECIQRAPGQSPLTVRERPLVTPASPVSPLDVTASVSPSTNRVKCGTVVSSSSEYKRKLSFTIKQQESSPKDNKIKLGSYSLKKSSFPHERTSHTKPFRKRAFEPTVTSSSQRNGTGSEKQENNKSPLTVEYPERKVIKLVKRSRHSSKRIESPPKSCGLSTEPSASMTRKENKIGVSQKSKSHTSSECLSPNTDISELNKTIPALEVIQEAMEVDTPCDVNSEGYYIVVDTNILISDLNFLDELKDQTLQGRGPPNIVIPWVVILELDGLKGNRSQTPDCSRWENQRKAIKAIKYIYSVLRNKHPRVRGQTLKEAQQTLPNFTSSCNDDKVLQCCLQIRKHVSENQVVLLSNDKNLLNKALINNIEAHSRESFEKIFRVDFSDSKVIGRNKETCLTTEEVSDTLKQNVDKMVCEAKQLLKQILTPVLVTEMKEAYEDLWEKIVLYRPPWSLIQVLQCFKKHWFAVFNFKFSREFNTLVKDLLRELKVSESYICEKKQALGFLKLAVSLSVHIQRVYGSAAATVERLGELHEQCQLFSVEEKCSNTRLKETSVDIQHKLVIDMFQYVWQIINHLSGMLLDSFGFSHDLQYACPQSLPNPQEAVKFLPKFFLKLRTLEKHMQSVIQTSCSVDPEYKESVSKFFHILMNFVAQLEVQLDVPPTNPPTLEMLELYCRNASNRECLTNGYHQLVHFYDLIHQCMMNIKGTPDTDVLTK
ncbi:swt1 RNA endoribonuclease isoform X2 [Tachypleus tridentatus]